jgi:hypothetical protein
LGMTIFYAAHVSYRFRDLAAYIRMLLCAS